MSTPGIDRPLTKEEVETLNTSIQSLLEIIAGLCDYVINTADRDKPPPACFLIGVSALHSFKSTIDALEAIDKAKEAAR